ncbi:hypothetical protein K443DRAFT_379278 [Laccaria amethystina LaAM-08-1]|uniref:Uncharacterized protein n=1 Tax=Laccaria amethystina LaAM-08-1 TaxID=1095629 RepID=A0A0C9YAJ3_9AGAR|nr:hypothetical protein K443DRAFT_379278 [Laccaria amethystina LaAM-08-1]
MRSTTSWSLRSSLFGKTIVKFCFHKITPTEKLRASSCTADFTALSLFSSIHPSTILLYTPPPTPASHTRVSPMVVFYRSACDSTTQSNQLNQPLHTPLPRVPEAHPQAPSTQDAVSYRTRPTFASPLLSSLNGANSPFLCRYLDCERSVVNPCSSTVALLPPH